MKRYKIAVLDDYQNVALESADWSVLRDRADIVVFQDHLADPNAGSRRSRFAVLFSSSCLLCEAELADPERGLEGVPFDPGCTKPLQSHRDKSLSLTPTIPTPLGTFVWTETGKGGIDE
jgi:hypothetical protein